MPVLLPISTPSKIAWIDWAARIQLRLKECPSILIADELRECAIRFYRDGRLWRETGVTVATTVAGQAEYSVAIASNTMLAGLPAIWVGEDEVDEATPGQGDNFEPDETGTTVCIGVVGSSTIRIYPAPDVSDDIVTATVAYCPTDDSTGLPEPLYFSHRDTIEDMALARLMSQAEKPWTSFALAGEHDRLATSGALYDSTMAGPVRRNRIRSKRSPV